jgi:hypothetical protein
VRMPERGVGEIGALERSFTRMAGSLGLSGLPEVLHVTFGQPR